MSETLENNVKRKTENSYFVLYLAVLGAQINKVHCWVHDPVIGQQTNKNVLWLFKRPRQGLDDCV